MTTAARTIKRRNLRPAWTGLALAALLLFPARADRPAQPVRRLAGFFGGSVEAELASEKILLAVPSAESFGRHLLYLTEEPHQTGSARNYELADYVRDRFLEYGMEDVRFHDTPALVGFGRSILVEVLEPEKRRLSMAEEPFPLDKDTFLYGHPAVVPYHEYAASGEVTAEAVYANGGSPEDFAELDRLGVDVRNKIVVMRYSTDPYSYRGYKVYQAESRGAAATIIYSDPQDDGYARGETYPSGPWGPESHIQWGSIVYDWFDFGNFPFTFHWEKQKDGSWVEGAVRARQLAKIPSVPMSHRDASEILRQLRGPVVPKGWQGGLPFTYHLGPGPARVHLKVENTEKIVLMRNVVAMVRGREEPEKWVIAGNHRDAWIYGGLDPSSGTAALLEAARSIGAALERGFRPRRTIVLANWDAEEDLLGGSTSWVKDNAARLRRDGVVYINLDSAASGPEFDGGSTPSLAEFLKQTAKDLPHPDIPGGSVYDHWVKASPAGIAEVDAIVGATDYTAFLEHIGMSAIDMTFDGPYGVYHSMYDDYFWMSRADPGFRYNTTCSRLFTLFIWRLANADLLPFRYSDYAQAAKAAMAEVEKAAAPEKELGLDRARQAADRWLQSSLAWEKRLEEVLASGAEIEREKQATINTLLLEIERAMTEEKGLRGRPFFKHLLFAPQPTYRPESLPRIFEAIQAGDWPSIARHEDELVRAFERAARLLERAGEELR